MNLDDYDQTNTEDWWLTMLGLRSLAKDSSGKGLWNSVMAEEHKDKGSTEFGECHEDEI